MQADNSQAASPRRRLKDALANGALTMSSIVITYLFLEVLFFRFMLPHLPLQYRVYLPDRADFFLQLSKSQYVPRDYIALVGDSYAQGLGDWLLSLGGKSNKPYHSADIIHEILHRDVVSLGRAQAGSAEAMVLRVTRIYDDTYCYLFPDIGQPTRFLIYFYEGNDLEDNYELLQHQIRPNGSELAPQVDAFLNTEYGVSSGWRCHGHLGDTIWKMLQYHIRYGLNPDRTYNIDPVPPINRIILNGVAANARVLHGGSMAMNDKQIEESMVVYDRSLAWLRRRFPHVPATVVYIGAPGAVYRYARDPVMSAPFYDPADHQVIGHPHASPGRLFPAAAIYANSQKICELIRTVSLAHGTAFIDTRPAFRRAAASTPLHGPRDWGHLNEAGYRLLGTLLAGRINEPAKDACDDRWEP